MMPRFSPHPPLACRILLLSALCSLPLLAMITGQILQQRQIATGIGQVQAQLDQQQQALRAVRAAQQRQLQAEQQQQRTPPLLTLLNRVGHVLTADVSLRSLAVEPQQQKVRLTVSAKSLSALLAFSERLQQLPSHTQLENHQTSADRETAWPVSATIDVLFTQENHHASTG